MSEKFKGISANEGIAIAKIFKLQEQIINIPKKKINDISKEINIFKEAIEKTKNDINKLKHSVNQKITKQELTIFDAHNQILKDEIILKEIEEKIKKEKINAAYAIHLIFTKYINMLKKTNDLYFKERINDIQDILNRLIKYILKIPVIDLSTINKKVILVTKDLTPSQTAQLNPKYIKGILCDVGGKTSHAAIIARSLEIPTILGLKNISKIVKNNEKIIINGKSAEIIIKPSIKEIKIWKNEQEQFLKYKKKLLLFKNKPTISKDGYKKIKLLANINNIEDIHNIIKNGGEGVGLFRSEFLYMNSNNFPDENTQFTIYKKTLEFIKPNKVIIRTLDIGGDKHLPYFDFPKELNPNLGCRAIRLCLKQQNIFRIQLRALLKASQYGKLEIMFPMIATIDEFKQAKKILLEEKKKLIQEGNNIKKINIGIMVEIPAAALIIDKFAKYVDFFSIGTNDLIQYSMGADRMNELVSYLYQPYNPSILKLIKSIVDQAHKNNKLVGICGEMAGDIYSIPILMGLKIDYFSMSSTNILKIRNIINKLNITDMINFINQAITCENEEEVKLLITKIFKNINEN